MFPTDAEDSILFYQYKNFTNINSMFKSEGVWADPTQRRGRRGTNQ